jgi:putative peptidoglycan binding protein
MKKILALTFCLALALTQMARAADSDKEKKAKKHAKREAVAAQRATQHSVKRNVQVQRKLTAPRVNQSLRRTHSESQLEKKASLNAQVQARQFHRNQAAINAQQHQAKQANQIANAQQRHFRNVRNRNSFAEARRHDWRRHHHRDWWRSHYTRFALFGGGYYYWHNNYWYPAYGYDPVYTTYVYDEPIYGYNELEPSQVIVNVQAELRRQGYYYGGLDGLIGPMTRSALARYQRDNGLIITRSIDEPTLESLGLA